MFDEYGNFGYDQVNVHPLNDGYFSTTSGATDIHEIQNTEEILRDKMYILEQKNRDKYKMGLNNDELYKNSHHRRNPYTKERVHEDLARQDIAHNIEKYFYGGYDTYQNDYYKVPYPQPMVGLLQLNNDNKQIIRDLHNIEKKNEYLMLFIVFLVVMISCQYVQFGGIRLGSLHMEKNIPEPAE